MTQTAQELISDSWELSQIVSAQAQVMTGFQLEQGLRLLNRILSFKQAQTDLIPYFKYDRTQTTIAGQEEYFIANCSDIQSITFDYGTSDPLTDNGTVRFPMTRLSAEDYLTMARVNGITSLPYSYMTQRVDGGTIVRLYFLPMDNWVLNIYGKFFLATVDLNTDLDLYFDSSYIEYLRWYLSKYMCLQYGRTFSIENSKQLRVLEAQLQYQSAPSPTINKVSTLQNNYSMGWGFINLYKGWVP